MTLNIQECNGTGSDVFSDMSKFCTVDRWLRAISKGKTSFHPHWIYVFFGDKVFRCGDMNTDADDMQEVISQVKQLPSSRRRIPNETADITISIFEHELSIRL